MSHYHVAGGVALEEGEREGGREGGRERCIVRSEARLSGYLDERKA